MEALSKMESKGVAPSHNERISLVHTPLGSPANANENKESFIGRKEGKQATWGGPPSPWP
eukprot:CAMPEP_0206609212 /NCGR_PEP_ID=MMETSP0325_2-20121206/53608_1 /ASSEMBLY_ACC=CAM_ASM_000347 /TAXON_ID=2866 /ORGANISM="Crypthecodinium cohnii, Strain Seligo" /LENGTH=59 /DNA_ID=CAMNT_0054127367 /DNA_START=112 /DNA_END=287 /DNA_ORIENTATION=+